jgi:hypothetical protein
LKRFFVTGLEQDRVREVEVMARSREVGGAAVTNLGQVPAGIASALSAGKEFRTSPVNAVSI